ncbi:oligosaccharide flippase family protein [Shewanella sp.]|uniref:oligosaccharide flippase family protein n=1 Tax=Shewanella sp. TaxID=50422 RepID=UPI0040478E32
MKNKSSVLSLFLSKFFPPILNFFVFVYSARILEPKDFGEVALALTLVFIVSSFLPSGWRDNLLKIEVLDSRVVSTVIWFHIIMSTFLLCLILLFFNFFDFDFYTENINNMFISLSIKIFLDCFTTIYSTLCIKYQLYYQLAVRTILCTFMSAITIFLLLELNFGVWALVLSQITISIFSFIILYIKFKYTTKFYFDFKIIKSMYIFAMPVSFVNGFSSLSVQLESFVVASFLGVRELGFFNVSKRLYDIIVETFITTITEVSLSKISKDINSDNEDKSIRFIKLTAITWWLMLPLISIAFIFSKDFFEILFTEKWFESISIFKYFCVIALVVSLGIPQRNLLILLGGATYLSKIQVVITFFSIPMYAFLISYNINLFLLALVLVKVVSFFLSLMLLTKYIDIKFISYFKILFNSVLALFLSLVFSQVLLLCCFGDIFFKLIVNILLILLVYTFTLELLCRKNKVFTSVDKFTFFTIIK